MPIRIHKKPNPLFQPVAPAAPVLPAVPVLPVAPVVPVGQLVRTVAVANNAENANANVTATDAEWGALQQRVWHAINFVNSLKDSRPLRSKDELRRAVNDADGVRAMAENIEESLIQMNASHGLRQRAKGISATSRVICHMLAALQSSLPDFIETLTIALPRLHDEATRALN